jgi:16S rRNA (guanine(966)-N(2))-methyltransferase RsmD
MRIIAGEFKGRQLSTVRDLSIRPTTDRAKQAIFDILSNRIDFNRIEVLDLFAGSGSLGLEALSRGARRVVFVENSRKSLAVLMKNIASLGCGERVEVRQSDVFWFLRNTTRSFDLVFVDPPYALETIGTLPAALYGSAATRAGTLVVMEHSRQSHIDLSSGMFDVTRKQFGQTIALILRTLEKS